MGLGRSQQPLTLGHPVTPRLRRARDGEKGIALASCVERTLPHTALVTAGDDQGMDTGTHARANARAHTHTWSSGPRKDTQSQDQARKQSQPEPHERL